MPVRIVHPTLPALGLLILLAPGISRPGDGIERTLSAIAQRLDRYARALDAHFGDHRLLDEQANSRVILSVRSLLQTVGGNQTDYALRIKLRLPRFERRLHLFFSKDSGNDGDIGDNSDFFGPRSSLDQSSNLGLQYFFREEKTRDISLRGGLKLRGGSLRLFIGPRYRRTFESGHWLGHFSEELLWHSDDGWQSDTRLDFERLLNENWLLRTHLRGLWLEQANQGYEYTWDVGLDQRLPDGQVIRYEWNNSFKTGIAGQLDETRLRLRYRRALWHKHLFGEIAPQLAFRDADGFRADWGIELKLELVID